MCDLGAYYKAPWSFQVAGDIEASLRSLAIIENLYLYANGDLGPICNPVLLERHPLYPHGHIAIGAARAGRGDLADGILDYLSTHRHPDLGAWGDLLDAPEPRRFDSISTACAGLALLERGRLDEAGVAVDFLLRLLKAQPDPDRSFLSTMYGSGELPGVGPGSGLGAERRVYFSGRFQLWWAISFPLLFLARYAEVIGEPHGLQAARAYLFMLDRCRQAWDDMSAGKAALGCGWLYRLTGEPGLRARAFKALRAVVSRLAADGGVRTPAGGAGGSVQSPWVGGHEVNAEFTLVLASAGQAVAQRDGAPFLLPAEMAAEERLDDWSCQAERLLLHKARVWSYRWHRSSAARWLGSRGFYD